MRRNGFTLIELLVVISIIGLMASVVMVSLSNARSKARDAKRKGDLHQLAAAMEMYYSDHNSTWPPDAFTQTGDWPASFKSALAPYMSSIPVDPLANNNINYYWWVHSLGFAPDPSCSSHAVLFTVLENSGGASPGNYDCGFGGNLYVLIVDKN